MAVPAASALAQQPLRLQIAGGRVTLHAQNVPVRTILAEWARLGGATIVNGEGMSGPPLTLELEGVPERDALNIVLRGASGYLLAARGPDRSGVSMFDRIVILPTSAAPRAPQAASAPVGGPPLTGGPAGGARPLPLRPIDTQNSGAAADDDEDGVPVGRPVPIQRPTPNPAGMPANPPPTINDESDTPDATTPPGVVVTPSNPFGLPPGSSTRPGVIAPAPTPAAPRGGARN
jgi:hypothetical protein